MSIFETRNGVLGLRRPLGGLPKLDVVPGTVAFVAVMIGTVTFDGLSQGQLWKDLSANVVDALDGLGIGALTASKIAVDDRAVPRRALVAGFYRLGIEGARSVGGGLVVRRKLECGFVHSLVPIAAVYVAAHYLTFLVFEGQAITYLACDPFGQGWNLFGTVDSGIDYTRLPAGGHVVRAGRGGRGRPRGGARAGPRPRAEALPRHAAGGALAVLDARRDGRLHRRLRSGCWRRPASANVRGKPRGKRRGNGAALMLASATPSPGAP